MDSSDSVLIGYFMLLQSLEDMDHEDAVKVLKDAQGAVSVINHTTVTCVDFIIGTLKMIVKYSPRGMYEYLWLFDVMCVFVFV